MHSTLYCHQGKRKRKYVRECRLHEKKKFFTVTHAEGPRWTHILISCWFKNILVKLWLKYRTEMRIQLCEKFLLASHLRFIVKIDPYSYMIGLPFTVPPFPEETLILRLNNINILLNQRGIYFLVEKCGFHGKIQFDDENTIRILEWKIVQNWEQH